MSRKYKHGDYVPSAVLAQRLHELALAFPDRPARDREFTMRIPAELDRDPDLVMAQAADRITALEAENARLMEAKDRLQQALALLRAIDTYDDEEWFNDRDALVKRIDALLQSLTEVDNGH